MTTSNVTVLPFVPGVAMTPPLAVNAVGLTAGSGDFLVSIPGTCASIAPAASCRLAIPFHPSLISPLSGNLTISPNAGTKTVTRARSAGRRPPKPERGEALCTHQDAALLCDEGEDGAWRDNVVGVLGGVDGHRDRVGPLARKKFKGPLA